MTDYVGLKFSVGDTIPRFTISVQQDNKIIGDTKYHIQCSKVAKRLVCSPKRIRIPNYLISLSFTNTGIYTVRKLIQLRGNILYSNMPSCQCNNSHYEFPRNLINGPKLCLHGIYGPKCFCDPDVVIRNAEFQTPAQSRLRLGSGISNSLCKSNQPYDSTLRTLPYFLLPFFLPDLYLLFKEKLF